MKQNILIEGSPLSPITIEVSNEIIFCEELYKEIHNMDEIEIKDSEAKKILRSLFYITQLNFSNDVRNNPYFILPEIKSDSEQLEILKYIDCVIHNDLKAKILDLDWIYNKNYKSAIYCANIYLELAKNNLNVEHWPHLTERLERAISILTSLKKIELITESLAEIKKAINTLNGNDELWLSYKLIQILIKYSNNIDDETILLIKKSIFNKYKKDQYEIARKMAAELIKAFESKNNERKKRSAQILILKIFKKEAIFSFSNENPMLASSLVQSALSFASNVKNIKKIRSTFAKLAVEYQSETIRNFGYFSTEVDRKEIFDSIDKILESATEKTIFHQFIKLFYIERKNGIIEKIKRERKEFIFQSLFSAIKYDQRNRVGSTFPPLPLDREPTMDEIWPFLIEKINFMQNFSGQHQIPYALYKINLHFRIKFNYLENLINQAWLVPDSIKKTCAKAIYHGYNGDLTTFLYISTPLYEPLIRHILTLKKKNEFIQNPNNGSQEEPPLKILLDNKDIQETLGEDLVIHLKALLIDEYGIKLRHNLSHGVFDDNAGFYACTYYSFLIFNYLIFSTIDLKLGNSA